MVKNGINNAGINPAQTDLSCFDRDFKKASAILSSMPLFVSREAIL